MKLGLVKDDVQLVAYDLAWRNEFQRVKGEICLHTNLQPNQIEHIGSTSIEDIQAKPVIDILIGIEEIATLQKEFFIHLQMAGFYRLRVERPNEIICAKFMDESFEVKTHFIHLVERDKEKWNQMLFFRDYLNANHDAKRQYENLKKSFFNTNLKGINEYTAYKEQFVQSIISKMNGGS